MPHSPATDSVGKTCMTQVRDKIKKEIRDTVEELQKKGDLPDANLSNITIQQPSRKEHGDYATAVAMQLASTSGRKPKTLAKIIAKHLQEKENIQKIFSEVEIATPGFVNLRLSSDYLRKVAWDSLKKENFGHKNIGKEKKINLEFASLNPTGRLHIGHGRTLFYGDALANILSFAGYDVTREYYVNNSRQSAQIKELGKTALGEGTSYKSPYLDKKIKEFSGQLKRYKNPEAAGYYISKKIQKDIKEFLDKKANVVFDVWFEEEELYKNNEVEKVIAQLKEKGLTYEKEGALWLETSRYGDSQDQVLVRKGGEKTYFASDIAYHLNKAERDFKKLINIWGADHQGHVRRIKSALRAFKVKNIEVLISQMVRLKSGAKLSKRKGKIVHLEDLIDEVGADAARYFYLAKSLDTQMEFDLNLAKQQSQKNPIYYIQYTHARTCSILNKIYREGENNKFTLQRKDMELLKEEGEFDLIRKLRVFPEVVEDIAEDYNVHRLSTYLRELAQEFNRFYRDYKVIGDDQKLQEARLVLTIATGLVLRQGLNLLGIEAPESM